MTTAAQIIFANPNSLEDKPTICAKIGENDVK